MSPQGKETKIFDPNDPGTGSDGAELLDSSVAIRGNQWYMFVAGQAHQVGAPQLFSATLPANAPLSATGWQLTRYASGELMPLAPPSTSGAWDGDGGCHCPAYVRGLDPKTNTWVERIYYAGGAQFIWGPYTIGYLEWDGSAWQPHPEPAFRAEEDWERGSVFEPNLIYHDGKWKMWYVAGSHAEDYLVHGYAESPDGRTWSKHTLFAPPEMRMFDFCVRPQGDDFHAIFSRVWVAKSAAPSATGLWSCHAQVPSADLAAWSEPVQIMTAEDRGWHVGPWKPSLTFDDQNPQRAFIFFDGLYNTGKPGGFPFAFTLGCLEIDLPLEV